MKVCDCSEECAKSELDLFSVPPTQTSVENGSWDNIPPHSNFQEGVITFEIPGDSLHYLDLSQTELWVQVAIATKTNNQITFVDFNAENSPDIAPVNNLLHSLFRQVEVLFNDKEIENTNTLYPYRAYIENLLCYNREEKETFLKTELFIKDNALKIANVKTKPANADDKDYNIAVLERKNFFKNQPVQLKGRLHCNVFNMNRFLLPNINVKVRLTRADPKFYLVGTLANTFITVVNCFLRVRRVQISPSTMLYHETMLEKTNAKYPISRVVVKSHVEQVASTTCTFPKIHTGVLPKRVVFGFCKTDEFDGTLTSNPFNFINVNLSNMVLKVSSQAKPYSSELEFNFTDNRYTQGYNTLFQGMGWSPNDITYEDYKSGYTLFAFNLSPDLCSAEHFNLQKDGSLELCVNFSTAYNGSLTLVSYLEFENILEITKLRNAFII